MNSNPNSQLKKPDLMEVRATGTIIKVEYRERPDMPSITNIVFKHEHPRGSTIFRISYFGDDADWTGKFYREGERIDVKGRVFVKTFNGHYLLQFADFEVLEHEDIHGISGPCGVFTHLTEYGASHEEVMQEVKREAERYWFLHESWWLQDEQERKAAEEKAKAADVQAIPDTSVPAVKPTIIQGAYLSRD